MELKTYLKQQRGRGTELAKAIKATTVEVSQWANGVRRVPAERCIEIERSTNGIVRCEDLRPDVDWSVLRGTAPRSNPGEAA